ncbi:MAG: hypothetical protein J6K45_03955 [Clostridia bacterium]|nr:hypothetical protein [Clostridia bacterium]
MKKVKSILNIFMAFIATFAININMDKTLSFTQSFSANSVVYLLIFVLVYWLLSDIDKVKNKRLNICSLILAVILALCETLGSCMRINGDIVSIVSVKGLVNFIGYGTLIYGIVFKLFSILENKEILNKDIKIFTNNKRSFFIVWGLIFILWIPYFLKHYPGICTSDSMDQISQTLGINLLTNHHPVFHTFLISIAINIGKSVGSMVTGIAIYSIFQMIILSAIFSFTLYYMAKRNIDIRIRLVGLLFFALYPINSIYSVTMWKDILFSGVILLFVIALSEVAFNKDKFMSSKFKNVLLVISMILVILFKNNGIYIVVLTLPFLFIVAKKYYKRLIVCSAIVIGFYMLWKGPVFSLLNVKEVSPREALTIPVQQIARITKYHGDELNEKERKNINKYLPLEKLPEIYVPTLSDNVKNSLNDEEFKKDKGTFIKTWIGLVAKYPVTAIESFIEGCYGYWYPEYTYWTYLTGIEKYGQLDIEASPLLKSEKLNFIERMINNRSLPIISMTFSIGCAFWVLITFAMYCIYTQKYAKLLAYAPILVLWLTCLASPVSGEYRYIYAMFITLPLLIGISFLKESKKEVLEDK